MCSCGCARYLAYCWFWTGYWSGEKRLRSLDASAAAGDLAGALINPADARGATALEKDKGVGPEKRRAPRAPEDSSKARSC
jgi:hypothetical protein